MDVKFLSFNIHHGRGTDRRVDLDRIIQTIQKSNSDIIGLNEVDKHFSTRSNFLDQVDYLKKELQMFAFFGPAISRKSKVYPNSSQYGNAILSKLPILKTRNHRFDFFRGLVESRSLLETDIMVNEMIVKVFVTHFSINSFVRNKQVNFISSILKDYTGPTILLGDLNVQPNSMIWKKLNQVLTDTWVVNHHIPGYTFPSKNPRKRLDYIFVSRHLHIIHSQVVMISPEASDHLPVQTKVTI